MKMGLVMAADIYCLLCARLFPKHLHRSSHLISIALRSFHSVDEQTEAHGE